MNKKLGQWFKGYVNCTLKGAYMELFINSAMKKGLQIWDISMSAQHQADFSITLSDFFKIKPILKKTYTRIHVKERVGLPFLLNKLKNRKGIGIGILLFLLVIYILSSMVWSIDIEGNKTLPEEEIFQTIDELGIHRGVFTFQLPENKVIQEYLLHKLENIIWVGVKLKGTNLHITIVEKVMPEKKPLASPRHIISTKNAIIHKVLATKGIPQVKVNDRVKKGDILISGLMGNEDHSEAVIAGGVVEGIVWYESKIVMTLKQRWKEYTGNILERHYITIGKKMIRIKGSKEIPFTLYQKKYNWKKITWKNYRLPLGFLEEKILEYEERERVLSQSDAINLALEKTKTNLFSKIESDTRLLSEKVLHQSMENGKVSIKILFEVIEDITAKQPIIQGE